MDAILSGAISLLKSSAEFVPSFIYLLHPCDTAIGNICLVLLSEILKDSATLSERLNYCPYCNNLLGYNDIPWKLVCSLPYKYLISNKVKEVYFKLLHRFYRQFVYYKKMFPEKIPFAPFVELMMSLFLDLFWDCVHVAGGLFVCGSLLDNFSLVFKDALFGFYNFNKKLKDKYFLINLFF